MNAPNKVKVIDDLRSYIAALEANGELHRVKTEVDWKFELCHVSKVNEEQKGPALLYENVKGYDIPVFTSAFTTSKRLAICLEQDPSLSMCQLSKKWMELTTKSMVKPQFVDNPQVKQNILEGFAGVGRGRRPPGGGDREGVEGEPRAHAAGVRAVGRQGALEDRDGHRRGDRRAGRRKRDERARRGRPGPRRAELRRDQPLQGLGPLADQRRRADAQDRAGPDGRGIVRGAGALHAGRGPLQDGAAGGRRRGRRRAGARWPEGGVHRRRLPGPQVPRKHPARQLRLADQGQRRLVQDAPDRRQHRPLTAPGHDRDRRDHAR